MLKLAEEEAAPPNWFSVDGRSPFEPEEEAALLTLFRLRLPWPCFAQTHSHIGQQYRSRGYHEKLALAALLPSDPFAANVHELFLKLKPEDASYLTQMASHVVTHFGTEFTEEGQRAVYDLLRFAVLGRTNRCAVSAPATRAQELCNNHPSELTLVFDVTAKTWAESLLAQDLSSKRWTLGIDPRELMRLVVAVGGAFHQPGTAFTIHQQSVVCKDSIRRCLDLTYIVDPESYYLIVFASHAKD
ncbi:hypothetical protein BASA81_011017 [Batrachochytrium salamandrivorans]|nr:hypothetical protein BASA81_011017 [Batrachochytrium salamandrivorans]